MHILLVDTTAFAPISPMFGDALDEWCQQHDATWSLVDESKHVSWVWNWMVRYEHIWKLPSVVVVMKGANILPETLTDMGPAGSYKIAYATDDPFNTTSCNQNVRDCIPLYDTYITTKRANVNELYDAGAKDVHYLPVAYKPSIHFPEAPLNDEEREKFACDICIIGGADEERIATAKKIIHSFPDKDIFLYGGYWDRDADTAPCVRGFAYGRDYRLAIGGAKVCVNLLRKANRDQHNMRTFEIPACGGLMLTQQTEEHSELHICGYCYVDEDDLLKSIEQLLNDSDLYEQVRQNAMQVVKPHTYQSRLEQLMALVKVQV